MIRILGCIVEEHDYRLVALAVVICLFTSYTALSLYARARSIATRSRYLWLAGTAVVAGSGVWATHFVAMLAYLPGLPTGYDVSLTAASIAVAILFGGLAFLVAMHLNRAGGGVAFGLSV